MNAAVLFRRAHLYHYLPSTDLPPFLGLSGITTYIKYAAIHITGRWSTTRIPTTGYPGFTLPSTRYSVVFTP